MCVHICVSFSIIIRSGGFQSSSHQKHSVFKQFFYIYKLTMEWFLNLWFIKKDNSKIHNIVDYFCYKCTVNFFFFLQKNKTVPWWLKLKQNKTTATATFYSMQHCNTWIGATGSLWETQAICVVLLSLHCPDQTQGNEENTSRLWSFTLPLFTMCNCALIWKTDWNILYYTWRPDLASFSNDFQFLQSNTNQRLSINQTRIKK